MCFSANASFATAGALSIISLLSVNAARNNKKILPLSVTPFFFALQQTCEGFVWITLNNGDTTSMLYHAGTYGFLFFASAWWPIWMPFMLSITETIPKRKKLLHIIVGIGATTAIMLFTSWTLQTTGAQVINHHINYPVLNYPFGITNAYIAQTVSWLISIGYCFAVITPFFISSITYAWILGIIIAIGLLTAYLFYLAAFPSVWCFFAAISSVLLYFIVKKQSK